jgi:amidase
MSMALRIPSRDDLHRLAQSNHFTLSNDEVEVYYALMTTFFPLFDQLDQLPEPHIPRRYPARDPGSRPERQHDPYNAIVRRCSVLGAAAGPLAGKRVGLKDNICIAGMPMTCGSTVLQGLVPDTDATIVTRLLDAGARIVAILNMDNFAFSGAGDTSAYGPTLNPHSLQHLAGGSSGGSAAALYYDDIDLTIGGDQGGSIRIPASWCGVVGLKPTHSLVPYTGIVGIDQTFDHAGPMARSVAEVAQAMEVLAGKDPLDPRQYDVPVQSYMAALGRDLRGIRVGVLKEGFGQEGAEADVDAAVRAATETLGTLGATVTEVSVPAHLTAGAVAWGLFAEGMAALLHSNGMGYHWRGAYNPAMAVAVGKSLQAQAADYPPQIKLVSMLGTYLRQHYHGRFYAKAQNLRPGLRASYDTVLQQVDVIAMPTTPMKAHAYEPQLGIAERILQGWNMLGNTAPFDMTGHPSLSIPCAKSQGLPVGLMLTGRHFEDATLLAVAHVFEQKVPWQSR